MEYLEIAIKLIIGLSVLNVWLLRGNQSSEWRGGGAKSLKEEFAIYGLSETTMKLVGFIKIVLSLMILLSIFYAPVEKPGLIGMTIMMIGAMAMHFKVSDPLKRSLPAFIFFALSLLLLFI